MHLFLLQVLDFDQISFKISPPMNIGIEIFWKFVSKSKTFVTKTASFQIHKKGVRLQRCLGLEFYILNPVSLSDCFCGYSIMVITLGCQSSDTGSIPVTRSKKSNTSDLLRGFRFFGNWNRTRRKRYIPSERGIKESALSPGRKRLMSASWKRSTNLATWPFDSRYPLT